MVSWLSFDGINALHERKTIKKAVRHPAEDPNCMRIGYPTFRRCNCPSGGQGCLLWILQELRRQPAAIQSESFDHVPRPEVSNLTAALLELDLAQHARNASN